MWRLASASVVVLAIAACGGSTAETTTSGAPAATTAPAAATTTTTSVSPDAVLPDPTTSTTADSTTGAPSEATGAKFAIVRVGLGVLGQVVIQNVGNEPGSLAGYWLCQKPSYYEFPDVELQPGELAAVSVTGRDDIFGPPSDAIAIEGIADLSLFDPASGEVGLYLGNAFSDPTAIVSYVEWGNGGHGRSGTAVSAQLWPEGGFVETSEQTGAILATRIPPTDPTHWFNGG